jgi:DNA (cytosine-5)-methyltransferase 1
MKPPYELPTMSDVARVRGTNGYKVVSTFSGCGGSCLGFELAGFEILWASEFVEAARETYAANHPGVHISPADIRDLQPQDILDHLGMKRGELDVLEGSPPCASFSTSGSLSKGWGKTKQYSDRVQRADDLFFEYARIVEGLQPKVFVAENVSGLVRGRSKGYFKDILVALRDCGYEVSAKVLDASWLGVPQSRLRLIFVGVRNDLVEQYGVHPAHPKPLTFQYTVGDVLDSVTHVKYGGKPANYKRSDKPAPTITASDHSTGVTGYLSGGGLVVTRDEITHDPETGKEVTLGSYAIGAGWDRTLPGKVDMQYLNLIKAHPDSPSPAITATAGQVGAAGVVHPTQRRKYTLEELRILSSFPADFMLTGSFEQRWERIGRSVPPLMMRAVAEVVRDEILAKIPRG